MNSFAVLFPVAAFSKPEQIGFFKHFSVYNRRIAFISDVVFVFDYTAYCLLRPESAVSVINNFFFGESVAYLKQRSSRNILFKNSLADFCLFRIYRILKLMFIVAKQNSPQFHAIASLNFKPQQSTKDT